MTENQSPESNTALGLKENLEALLCYSLGFITGIVFLLLEKENKFVRFHAMQSIAVFLVLFVGSMILIMIPFIGAFLSILISPVSLVLWVFLMYKAFQGEKYKLPYIGEFVEEQLSK
jgi:uncharacterized membrane protein